jgi:hypothetical protein
MFEDALTGQGIPTMHITVSTDDQVAQNAQMVAQKMGKSLDQVVLNYL